jgi:hypothetical protein
MLRNELATAGAGSICLDWFRKKKLNTELNYGAAAPSSHKKLLRDALVARRAVVLASVNHRTPDRAATSLLAQLAESPKSSWY